MIDLRNTLSEFIFEVLFSQIACFRVDLFLKIGWSFIIQIYNFRELKEDQANKELKDEKDAEDDLVQQGQLLNLMWSDLWVNYLSYATMQCVRQK